VVPQTCSSNLCRAPGVRPGWVGSTHVRLPKASNGGPNSERILVLTCAIMHVFKLVYHPTAEDAEVPYVQDASLSIVDGG
jgi:hypothetical protein